MLLLLSIDLYTFQFSDEEEGEQRRVNLPEQFVCLIEVFGRLEGVGGRRTVMHMQRRVDTGR